MQSIPYLNTNNFYYFYIFWKCRTLEYDLKLLFFLNIKSWSPQSSLLFYFSSKAHQHTKNCGSYIVGLGNLTKAVNLSLYFLCFYFVISIADWFVGNTKKHIMFIKLKFPLRNGKEITQLVSYKYKYFICYLISLVLFTVHVCDFCLLVPIWKELVYLPPTLVCLFYDLNVLMKATICSIINQILPFIYILYLFIWITFIYMLIVS